jgi:hypothetical protein
MKDAVKDERYVKIRVKGYSGEKIRESREQYVNKEH